MRGNILFVGLDYEHIKKIANQISQKFDMFFLDVKDLIQYNLIDTKNVKSICGEEYLQKEENKIALSVKNYVNTLINFPHELFLKDHNSNQLKESAITIYLRLDKKTLNNLNKTKNATNNLDLSLIAFKELDKIIASSVDFVVNISDDEKESIESILKEMKSKLV